TDARTGDVWVADDAGNSIRRFQRDGTAVGAHDLPLPSRVAVDSLTGVAWVTSANTGRLWRVSPAVTPLDSTFRGAPIGVALDWRRRTAWIADAGANSVVAIDMDTRAQRFRVGNLPGAVDVDVDLARGDAWVVARDAASVTHLSATGAVLGQVGNL